MTHKTSWYARQTEEKKALICQRRRDLYAKKKHIDRHDKNVMGNVMFDSASNNAHQTRDKNTLIGETQQELYTINKCSSSYNDHGSTSTSFHVRDKSSVLSKFSIFDIPQSSNMIPYIEPCAFCGAVKFLHESPSFCCSSGEVQLVINTTPEELYCLFSSNNDDSEHFRTYVRTYNNSFAFTSFGVREDAKLSRRNKGIYTFRAQGQIYHFMRPISQQEENPSQFQLYFYDTDMQLQYRTRLTDRLLPIVLEKLMRVLEINPYAILFRSLGNMLDITQCVISIKSDTSLDQRTYNYPRSSEVAAIWFGDGSSVGTLNREIIVYAQSDSIHKIHHYYGCYDPLQYPLLFPRGETGWHQGILRINRRSKSEASVNISLGISNFLTVDQLLLKETEAHEQGNKNRFVSCREYYAYKLQIRVGDFSCLLQSGRLLQQYVVDMYVKIETTRLDFFRTNQSKIRAELYQGIVDSIHVGETNAANIGKRIILPATFIGGPRDMRKRYMDAMTLVQRFGKPDIFLTMTCNPNWPEIKSELLCFEEAHNRPDLITRIFRAKLEELKVKLFKEQIFGSVAAHVYVIEFQKRGLPHAHILLILEQNSKIMSPDSFDDFVCAELPDHGMHPYLYDMVVKHMMHGPCGTKNPLNVCMNKEGKCRNNYPKSFCAVTEYGKNSYPRYRRRQNNRCAKVRGAFLDNRWVVPYNPYLLALFDCHLNVEICSTIKAVKYLYKYIYKGHDRVAFQLHDGDKELSSNEIENYQTGRWISPPEAMWRIYGFSLNEIHPPVYTLQLHLQHQQSVTFTEYSSLENLVKYDALSKTMLTDYFSRNCFDSFARTILYKQFPEYYTWNRSCKTWQLRKKSKCIGRVVSVSPVEGERYYLRLLLDHIKGSTSFENLKIVQGRNVNTFREAALLHGLLQEDDYISCCIQEAATFQMPFALRRLFATLLVYCQPNNPSVLWNTYKQQFSEDYVATNVPSHTITSKVLAHIDSILQSMGKSIHDYNIVPSIITEGRYGQYNHELDEETKLGVDKTDFDRIHLLNDAQRNAYEMIIQKILHGESGTFFIDGPGGSGKTFLYRALLAKTRFENLIALATASSGVAASILPGGRTAHSRFKIPLQTDTLAVCSVSKQSNLAELLRLSRLIIWDEAPMCRKETFEAVNNMLQDINGNKILFGGKVIVFGGDFRQVLPVVPKGTKSAIIDASLCQSFLWQHFTKFSLTSNMRASKDPDFASLLLRIGNGTEPYDENNNIFLPMEIIVPYTDDFTSISTLVNIVFPSFSGFENNCSEIVHRGILTPKNEYVDVLNNIAIERFPGEITRYYSFDSVLDSADINLNNDFINTLTPSGFPPHELLLKPNCPVMLLRNINSSEGLCNGTRLICRRFEKNVIDAEICTGDYRGKRVFLPRIPFIPLQNEKDVYPFKRVQFPIRPCFSMTINKAQGQTMKFVGIYLPEPVFSHGQLYVALSRATTLSSVRILIRPPNMRSSLPNKTRNIVYKEVLSEINNDTSAVT